MSPHPTRHPSLQRRVVASRRPLVRGRSRSGGDLPRRRRGHPPRLGLPAHPRRGPPSPAGRRRDRRGRGGVPTGGRAAPGAPVLGGRLRPCLRRRTRSLGRAAGQRGRRTRRGAHRRLQPAQDGRGAAPRPAREQASRHADDRPDAAGIHRSRRGRLGSVPLLHPGAHARAIAPCAADPAGGPPAHGPARPRRRHGLGTGGRRDVRRAGRVQHRRRTAHHPRHARPRTRRAAGAPALPRAASARPHQLAAAPPAGQHRLGRSGVRRPAHAHHPRPRGARLAPHGRGGRGAARGDRRDRGGPGRNVTTAAQTDPA